MTTTRPSPSANATSDVWPWDGKVSRARGGTCFRSSGGSSARSIRATMRRARPARERAHSGLDVVERNVAHRHAEIVLDFLLELDLAAEVRQREPAVDRRGHAFGHGRRGEELVELVAIVDLDGVVVAIRGRAIVEAALD